MANWWRRKSKSGDDRLRPAQPTALPRVIAPLTLPSRATGPLRAAAAAWLVGLAPSYEVVGRAADLLAETGDDASFLAIAVLPLNPETDTLRAALLESFNSANDSAAIEGLALGSIALRWACGALIDGRLAPDELCRWAYRYSMWTGPAVFEPFEVLDDEFGEAKYVRGRPRAEIDADVRAVAIAYLSESSGLEE